MNILDLQRGLYRLGFDPGGCDGTTGPKTRAAILAFASAAGVSYSDDDPESLVLVEAEIAHELEALPAFIEAKNYSRSVVRPIDVIVIHTAEAPEIHHEARNVAGWFQLQPRDGELVKGVRFGGTSAHYVVDDEEVVQCVLECDMSWHAGHGNGHSIGIEHAGYASQTPEQWEDDYSKAVLAKSAELVARLCKRFQIPIVRLSPAELAAGARGICGHVDVTNAFSGGKGHQDPGPSFPWAAYLDLVKGS